MPDDAGAEGEPRRKASQYGPHEMSEALFALVEQCKMADGSVPAESYLVITVEELRKIAAGAQYLKNMALATDSLRAEKGGKRK